MTAGPGDLKDPDSSLSHQAAKATATAANRILQDVLSGSNGPIADHARESARAFECLSAHAGFNQVGTKVASKLGYSAPRSCVKSHRRTLNVLQV
jgi:hypothetical protein